MLLHWNILCMISFHFMYDWDNWIYVTFANFILKTPEMSKSFYTNEKKIAFEENFEYKPLNTLVLFPMVNWLPVCLALNSVELFSKTFVSFIVPSAQERSSRKIKWPSFPLKHIKQRQVISNSISSRLIMIKDDLVIVMAWAFMSLLLTIQGDVYTILIPVSFLFCKWM